MTQPYSNAPFMFSDQIEANDLNNITEWVYVQIRDLDRVTILEEHVVLLRKDGFLIDPIQQTVGLSLYSVGSNQAVHFVIYAKGHLAVMSDTPVVFSNDLVFDISNNPELILNYTNQLKEINGYNTLIAGDINSAGIINSDDFIEWFNDSAAVSIYAPYDIDKNGIVNTNDFTLWFANRSKVGVSWIMW